MSNSVREVIGELKTAIRSEWGARTTYGKLWFPVWLLATCLLFAFLGGLATMKYLWKGFDGKQREPLFEVYDDDE